jgi:signal transduction histidine kinase
MGPTSAPASPPPIGAASPAPPPAPARVPRSFRRDSRLFLSVALLLILFLNFVTLLFFRNAVAWGSQQTERRAAQLLRRLALAAGDPLDSMERLAVDPDVLFIGFYDAAGRRVLSTGQGLTAPEALPTARPAAGTTRTEWKRNPGVLAATFAARNGYYAIGLDPGSGTAMRSWSRSLSIVIPLAGAALVVLAWLYLRSLLDPYDRLLVTAGSAPSGAVEGAREPADERDFLIARFEATIAALSEKERELEGMARTEKERADDLETAGRILARNLPTGLLSVDRAGLVVDVNEAGREILGLASDPRGIACRVLLSDLPRFRDLVDSVLRDRSPLERQEVRWRRGSQEGVIGVTVAPATGADGRFLGVLALFSDLSEVRRLERRVALARHLADLGEVSAGAAHEFRNAAAAIDGYADLALRHPERSADHLRAIRREAQEMSRVTSDFLLFARPEGFVPERVDLRGVVEAAAAETEAAFPPLSVARGGEFGEIAGSAVLLRRAVANLLRNAAEATPPDQRREPGAVVVEGRASSTEVAVSVADRGPGVDRNEREKVFLPFYSTKSTGAGFGLAIVARIAELHGGTVDVDDRPGGGGRFTLRLPLGSAAGDGPTPPPRTGPRAEEPAEEKSPRRS